MRPCQRPLLLIQLLAAWLLCHSATAAATAAATDAAAAAPAAAPPPFCQLAPHPNAGAPTDMVWGGDMLKVYHNLHFHNKKWYAVLGPSSNASSIDQGMSLNAHLIKLPATDAHGFQQNLKVCYVPGLTLLLDFPFPAFPDNLGHWAELLLPLYSALSSSSSSLQQVLAGQQQRYIDRLLLLNVRQQLLYNWPKEVLGLALAPALPPWPQQQRQQGDGTADSSSTGSRTGSSSTGSSSSRLGWHEVLPWDRPLPPIINPVDYEAWATSGWLVFENVVVLQDRYPITSIPDSSRPPRPTRDTAAAAAASSDAGLWSSEWTVGFNQPHLAASFRTEALSRHLWDRPVRKQQQSQQQQQLQEQEKQQCGTGAGGCAPGSSSGGGGGSSGGGSSSGIPRTVTVLWYPEDYPPVTNHRQLVTMLEDLTEPYGFKVRSVSLTMGAPFLSHMATMADTGLLVGRHGPLLASAVLLPPGAAVLELLPYKWEWRGVSRLYYNMTQSTGQLHHWAWRPLDAKWCKYKEPSDSRFAGWLPNECQGQDCLLVHARAGLEVDLDAVRDLLARKLPGLVAGEGVEALKEPWPAAE